MPLSPPAPRRHFHTRDVRCEGFLRDDGLWDIEGHIRDTKAYGYDEVFRGRMEPGRPVHEMRIRLTLDDAFEIVAIEAVTDAAPYPPCGLVPAAFARLKGIRIGAGWRREVRKRLGRVEGCTHLIELLDPIATVAFQTVSGGKDPEGREPTASHDAAGGKPYFVDGCRAWASDGPVVKRLLPQYYRGDEADGPASA